MSNKIITDVLILIEHKARELESAVLLKYFLEKYGLKVVVDSIKFHKEDVVLKYIPSIAIVPWAYSNKEMNLFRNFNRFKNKNKTTILNMHHEQISNDGSDQFIIPKEDAKKTIHVSWGENYTQKLIEAGCRNDAIIQCGNPKLDFYKSDLIRLSKTREELSNDYNIDSSKKWIIFIANSFHLLSESQISNNISKGVDIIDQISTSIDNRKDFFNFASDYLEKNNDSIFIYRPHPSYAHLDKDTKEIKEMCSKFNNFRCISENSIRDWIINVDVAMSFHSTSVIECAVTNTPFYLFRTRELSPNKDYKFFPDYKYKITDRTDFINAINNLNEFSFNEFINDINEYIDLNIKEYSSQIIADKIVGIYKENSSSEYVDFKMDIYLKVQSVRWLKKLIFFLSKKDRIKQAMLKVNDIRLFNLLYEGDDYLDSSDLMFIEKRINSVLEYNKGKIN